MTTPTQTTPKVGDLVEVTHDYPWSTNQTNVGKRLLVSMDPEPLDEAYTEDGSGISGDGFTPEDPAGMWGGGDDIPVSHVRVIKSAKDLLPSASSIAKAIQSGLLDADEETIRVREVGEHSDDGTTMYAIGLTPDGVRVSFLVKVGAVEMAD